MQQQPCCTHTLNDIPYHPSHLCTKWCLGNRGVCNLDEWIRKLRLYFFHLPCPLLYCLIHKSTGDQVRYEQPWDKEWPCSWTLLTCSGRVTFLGWQPATCCFKFSDLICIKFMSQKLRSDWKSSKLIRKAEKWIIKKSNNAS